MVARLDMCPGADVPSPRFRSSVTTCALTEGLLVIMSACPSPSRSARVSLAGTDILWGLDMLIEGDWRYVSGGCRDREPGEHRNNVATRASDAVMNAMERGRGKTFPIQAMIDLTSRPAHGRGRARLHRFARAAVDASDLRGRRRLRMKSRDAVPTRELGNAGAIRALGARAPR